MAEDGGERLSWLKVLVGWRSGNLEQEVEGLEQFYKLFLLLILIELNNMLFI